jgi:capsular polysaccharide biosynthesis protein
MPYSDWSKDPERWHLIGFPALSSIVAADLGRHPVVHEERVLSLRFYWEDNYFHFLNDILPRLRMAREFDVPLDVPVVVGERLAKQRFFLAAFPDGLVDGRRMIVQSDAFIAADEIIVACPEPCARENFSYVADALGGPAHPSGTRRIFVDRAPSRGRFIRNMSELLPALRRNDVEVVDPESMSLREQVELFAETELIAGIHGAGLGNMLFRRDARTAVLEIFQPLEAPPWFAHMAAELGFCYDALSGYAKERMYHRMQPFCVDPGYFEEKLAKLIARCDLGK